MMHGPINIKKELTILIFLLRISINSECESFYSLFFIKSVITLEMTSFPFQNLVPHCRIGLHFCILILQICHSSEYDGSKCLYVLVCRITVWKCLGSQKAQK